MSSVAWLVYMIRCGDGSLYTGVTNDLPKRLHKHRTGKGAKYTAGRGPLTVVWESHALDKPAALKLEAKIKRMGKAAKERVITTGEWQC